MHGTSTQLSHVASVERGLAALPSFCVALPVYNEAAVIESCIGNIARFLDTVDARTGIIAVDDGSADDSFEVMRRMQDRLPQLVVHRHERNGGYGTANRTLCHLAADHHFDYAIVMDADGTQDPRYLENFFPQMRQGVDFIKATRYRLGGGVDGVPWQRYVISRYGNLLARLVMDIPLSDFSNGFRAIRTEKWQQIKSTERAFELLIEECHLAKQLGMSFGEVPYILTNRQVEGSESKFSYRWGVYRNYLRYVFKR
jgi:glycosyltransferase involved in cell wall biosynthesis